MKYMAIVLLTTLSIRLCVCVCVCVLVCVTIVLCVSSPHRQRVRWSSVWRTVLLTTVSMWC